VSIFLDIKLRLKGLFDMWWFTYRVNIEIDTIGWHPLAVNLNGDNRC
tara:strand:- start:309 stop:449 length:141 start_codon:yes stop_codon:yes gene_type:complete